MVQSRLCVSCGACVAALPESVRLEYDARAGLFLPTLLDEPKGRLAEEPQRFCPGLGVPISSLAERYLGRAKSQDVELGRWEGMWAARSSDGRILHNASSGGVMTAIASYLLAQGLVDGVVATRLVYGPPGPRPETFVATRPEELLSAQGSKYCPVPAVSVLASGSALPGRLAFVGTPCQIGAVRMLQDLRPDLSERIRFCIGSFCGGVRDFRETDTLLRKYGLDPARVVRFRYRGGGQPGSLEAEDDAGRVVSRPYPAYVRDTGFAKLLRCRLCADATAELADFSCGDAWLDRFLARDAPWSILIARTPRASRIVLRMVESGSLVAEDISPEDVKRSQAVNLASKKRRQHARRRLYGLLGQPLPGWGGYEGRGGSLLFEAAVATSHWVTERAETGSFLCGILAAAGRKMKGPVKAARNRLLKGITSAG